MNCSLVLGCQTQDINKNTSSPKQVRLTPYLSTTSKQISEFNQILPTKTIFPTLLPSPTSTPHLYTIAEGDTFTSIALRHGIKVSDLIASNPGVDPNFLTIGNTITIPLPDNSLMNDQQPTPIPVDISTPVCYHNKMDELWCLSFVKNNQSYDLENISAEFHITGSEKSHINSEIVFSPLYVIPSGLSAPIVVYFPPPIPANYRVQAKILSSIPKSNDDSRYLSPAIQKQNIRISKNGLSAIVTGEVFILENVEVQEIWVVAVAYSQEEIPVGFRKWESPIPLAVGETISFEFNIYSLGPPIDDVKLLVEAHP
jgi:LysM repeat protein